MACAHSFSRKMCVLKVLRAQRSCFDSFFFRAVLSFGFEGGGVIFLVFVEFEYECFAKTGAVCVFAKEKTQPARAETRHVFRSVLALYVRTLLAKTWQKGLAFLSRVKTNASSRSMRSQQLLLLLVFLRIFFLPCPPPSTPPRFAATPLSCLPPPCTTEKRDVENAGGNLAAARGREKVNKMLVLVVVVCALFMKLA